MINLFIVLGVLGGILVVISLAGYRTYSTKLNVEKTKEAKTERESISKKIDDNTDSIIDAAVESKEDIIDEIKESANQQTKKQNEIIKEIDEIKKANKKPEAQNIIYNLLDKINPIIIENLTPENNSVCIMISQPKMNILMEYKNELLSKQILKIESNGSVNYGFGNKIGNCINDLDEGHLFGFNIYALKNFKFKI